MSKYIKRNTKLKGKLKKFDPKLDSFDVLARKKIKQCLGDSIIDNPETYGEDMLVITNRIPYGYIELQVYVKWKDVFPASMPYIYERKMRFNPNTLFVCFNNDLSKAILFSRTSVGEKAYRAKKYSREFVHYVQWHKTMEVDTKDLTLDTILCFCDPVKYFVNDENIENIENIVNLVNIEDKDKN